MKKLFVLVSCFAVLLVLSNVSFAQEAAVAVEGAPCACCTCTAVAPAPFAYPPFPVYSAYQPAPKVLGAKCALKSKNTFAPYALPFPPQALPVPQALPMPAPAFVGYPYAPPVKPFAARRAARLAAQPMPAPMPAPIPGLMPAPGFAVAPPMAGAPAGAPGFAPAPNPFPQQPSNYMGDLNKVNQRVGGAPVINLFSVVRAPRGPFDPNPYTGYYPAYGYPQPALESAE